MIRNIIAILFIIGVTLPMLFLVTVALGDITASGSPDQPGMLVVRHVALTIAVLWFFDLVLLILTLAAKELLKDISLCSSTSDKEMELLEDE